MKKLVTPFLFLGLVACSRPADGSSRPYIENRGSDTLVNVAQAWAESYKTVDPEIAVAVSGGGSGTGIAALINGTVDIANSSRKMKPKEIEAARANGVEPVEFVVGYDALAVYVHKDNPVDSLTLPQLADIYGDGRTTTQWSQLGVAVPGCSSAEIILVGRQNSSGTYAYFKNAILGKGGEYTLDTKDMHGSKDVVDLVGHTPCAIGYSGLAYATPRVKMVSIAKAQGDTPVAPSVESATNGSYPITRPLFMYTRGQPTGIVKEYLGWVLSDEGQQIIKDKGYAPVREL